MIMTMILILPILIIRIIHSQSATNQDNQALTQKSSSILSIMYKWIGGVKL